MSLADKSDHRRLDDRDRPLTCQCWRPIPEEIRLFDTWQCKRCLRKIDRHPYNLPHAELVALSEGCHTHPTE